MKQLSYTSLMPTEDGKAFIDDKGKTWQPRIERVPRHKAVFY